VMPRRDPAARAWFAAGPASPLSPCPTPVLNDLHVEATADQQGRQVVPQVVEAEPLR
jgi:hypothetical protein